MLARRRDMLIIVGPYTIPPAGTIGREQFTHDETSLIVNGNVSEWEESRGTGTPRATTSSYLERSNFNVNPRVFHTMEDTFVSNSVQ